MPKVSIIVPVYNSEKYLNKCLESLVNQTLEDIEIIVVNDGSFDNSAQIIKNYCIKYPRKIISLLKENGGLSDARNFGLSCATGEYVGFVDSDDYVDTNMFLSMYESAINENLDLVECNFSWIYDSNIKLDIGKEYDSIKSFFVNGRVMVCNKIFKTEIIKENHIEFPLGLIYEDIEFFYKYIPYVKRAKLLNESLYFYVQREESISNKQGKQNEDIFKILENIILFYKKQEIYSIYEQGLEYLYIRFLLGSSFLRIIKIKNKKLKSTLLFSTWKELNETFPNWKKNQILKSLYTKKDLYYKTINKFTYKLYSKLFIFLRSKI